jgi:LysM repeat protein
MSQEGIMTRETKIGLLVGLSFIIVVGILLSDHIADSNRPPQALLSDVGNNVRNSVAIPQPAIAQPAAAPGTVANVSGPSTPVPTHEELHQTAAPAQTAAPTDNVVVGIGPGESVKNLTQPTPVVAQAPAANQTTMPLAAIDQPVDNSSTPDNSAVTPIKLTDSAPASDKILKQYKVEKGDTLGKIAKHFYGTSSHAAVAAILAANPQLKGNAARLAIGKTYAIPEFDKAPASPTAHAEPSHSDVALVDTNTMAIKPTTRPSALASIKSRVRSPGGTYTVKSGDTLWKIAVAQLGSARQLKQIEELNPGALHHGQLKIGTVLKMPAKTVATAD